LISGIVEQDICFNFDSTLPNSTWHDPQSGIFCIADAQLLNRNELDSRASSDAHLIALSYERWGINCLNKLLGDYAFAIWDSRCQKLILASDPLGQRSLFYANTEEQSFCFSNLPGALFKLGVSRDLNRNRIADVLVVLGPSQFDTCFKSIKRLPGGHFLEKCIGSTPLITRYWSASALTQDPLNLPSPDDYYASFRELFQQVIAQKLSHISGQVASQLSGGLDSSAVSCVTSQLLKDRNQSLLAMFHSPTSGLFKQPRLGSNYDDTPFVEAVKKQQNNLTLIYIKDDNKQLFEYSDLLNQWLDNPLLNPSNVLWIMTCVEEAQRLAAKTIFTGAGGNSTFSWTGNLHQPKNPSIVSVIESHLRRFRNTWVLRSQNPTSTEPWRQFSAVSRELARETNLLERFNETSVLGSNRSVKDPRIFEFSAGACGTSARFNALIRSLYGIEFWDPTLDKRIVEFCLRTPVNIFQNKGRSRLLVRESMRGIMPDIICDRQTRGMQAADWYKKVERQKTELQDLLQSWTKTEVAHYIDVDALSASLSRWDYQKVSTSQNRKYVLFEFEYHQKLLRGIEMGKFIQTHLN
jgi:asparagine synthase (glutamine-hydrolysing)